MGKQIVSSSLRALGASVLLLSLGATVACGPPPPPKELVSARTAYQRASEGMAQKLAPAALDSAKQALQAAERSFRDEADTPETRALAYIADRQARLSEAVAALEQAVRDKDHAEKQYKELSASELERAREALKAEKDALEKERLAREASDKARTEADKARAEAERGRLEAERGKAELEKKYAAALASLKELASVKEEQRGVVITLSGAVLFASGKSELLSIAKDRISDVAKVLKEQSYPPLRIEGHTDSTGSAEENRKLSLERAESVKQHLVSQGYPAAKIKTAGLGPDRAVADNGSPEGRANNRRVEIIVNPRD